LSKIFGENPDKKSFARSGLIILPCGAGKTLVGICLINAIKKSTLILCNSRLSVDQWRRMMHNFAEIPTDSVLAVTSKEKPNLDDFRKALVIITT